MSVKLMFERVWYRSLKVGGILTEPQRQIIYSWRSFQCEDAEVELWEDETEEHLCSYLILLRQELILKTASTDMSLTYDFDNSLKVTHSRKAEIVLPFSGGSSLMAESHYQGRRGKRRERESREGEQSLWSLVLMGEAKNYSLGLDGNCK